MIWKQDISFEEFDKKVDEWYNKHEGELCDPPIDAQFALELIFKTLVDDKEHYPYLTTLSESTDQTNSLMLDLILKKYSRKYTKHVKHQNKQHNLKRTTGSIIVTKAAIVILSILIGINIIDMCFVDMPFVYGNATALVFSIIAVILNAIHLKDIN